MNKQEKVQPYVSLTCKYSYLGQTSHGISVGTPIFKYLGLLKVEVGM